MNKETSEIVEVSMKYSELAEYLEQNPSLQQVFTRFPGLVDPVSVGVRKTDSNFKDVLSKAKGAHHKSTIEY